MFFFLLLCVSASLAYNPPNCGLPLQGGTSGVWSTQGNEEEYTDKDYTWMVSVEVKANKNYPDGGACSGSLISDRHVVTAAHCFIKFGKCDNVYYTDLSDLSICHRGANCKEGDNNHYKVVQDECKYKRSDIAILTLDRKVENSVPVCLPENAATDLHYLRNPQEYFTVAGFSSNEKTPGNDKIRRAVVYIQYPCGKLEQNKEIICTTIGVAGACKGDSGGPLTEIHNGRHMLVGINVITMNVMCTANGPLFSQVKEPKIPVIDGSVDYPYMGTAETRGLVTYFKNYMAEHP